MLFVRLTPGTPMADIVAVPFQVPANAAGIVPPVAGVAGVASVLALAGLLAWPASELLCVPTGGPEGDLWVSNTMPKTATPATAAPTAPRISPRRSRAGAGPGPGNRAGSGPEMVGSASRGNGPVAGAE